MSGSGGSRGYLDVAQLGRAGVQVAWQSFAHPSYPQRYPALGFLPQLAALDLLFNCGPAGSRLLRESLRPQASIATPVAAAAGGGTP